MATRRAAKGRPLKQEKYMSAVNLRRPVLANLVARRVEPVPDPKHRELIWWLQELSLRRPGAPHGTCALFTSVTLSPLIEGATSFEQLSHDLCSRYPDRLSAQVAKVVRVLPAFFMRLCLDPRLDVATAAVPRFRDIIPALQETRVAYQNAHLHAVAPTSVARAVWELLDFCRQQGGIVIAEGYYRSGKSFSAQSWCLARPGQVRYVSLGGYPDETSFLRAIASSLGTAATAQKKAIELRLRVEDVLRSRDICLVVDESEYTLPQTPRAVTSPLRLQWLMSLANAGVPVALIAGENFSRLATALESRLSGFSFSQFWGRVGWRRRLPDSLCEEDLFLIARKAAPEADHPSHMLMVGHTLGAKGRVAELESTVKRARFIAQRAGRPLSFDDVEEAIADSKPAHVARRAPAPALTTAASNFPQREAAPSMAPAIRPGDRLAVPQRPLRRGAAAPFPALTIE